MRCRIKGTSFQEANWSLSGIGNLMMRWIGAAVSCSHENRLLAGSGTGGKHEQKVRSKEKRKTAVWGHWLHLRRCHELHMLNADSQFVYDGSRSLPAYLQNSLNGMASTKQSCEFLHAVFNPLKPELNPICYLLALLGAHHFLHVSRIRVKLLTFR